MLIFLSSDGKNLENPVAKRFGHANYFILFKTETKNMVTFTNTDERHNHENLQLLLNKGIEAFVVGNIGPHAFEIINTNGSKVYLARKMSVEEAIEKLRNGELKQLNEPTTKRSIGRNN